MKIISPGQMTEIESLAYQQGASSADFMEEAGSGIALVVHDYVERNGLNHMALLLCGKGNNAGDAYVAGTHLLDLDYDVSAIQLVDIDECSFLCKQNYERFISRGGRIVEPTIDFPKRGVIIDGLFGTGFQGIPTGIFSAVIRSANKSKLPIIAVDIPSGLNGETGETPGDVITATETAFLGLPKTGFFLNNGWNHVGKLHYVDFGLPQKIIDECESNEFMLTTDLVEPHLPSIVRNRNKYEAGYVVGLAGSPGMPGAAILASISALRGGAGIVRLLHPQGMEAELASSPYEIIRTPYRHNHIEPIIEEMNRASSTFIGPGLGTSPDTCSLLRAILPRLEKPCAIDADALNFLAENEDVPLPKHTIMTPHMGEMMRLLKLKTRPEINLTFLDSCRAFAEKKQVTLVLKGGPSFIFQGNLSTLTNPTGDPGMATAGTGDILTGLIASLLAQGLPTREAASLAVFLHGLAGEHAAEEMTSYAMTASDLLYHFPEAFKFLAT